MSCRSRDFVSRDRGVLRIDRPLPLPKAISPFLTLTVKTLIRQVARARKRRPDSRARTTVAQQQAKHGSAHALWRQTYACTNPGDVSRGLVENGFRPTSHATGNQTEQ
ncbi:hypothetical protein Bbelb_439510 [Branchiostoma belcheri]|nr:hypothetical protein Bbelb_439510 [Branchiostoma belcheri]